MGNMEFLPKVTSDFLFHYKKYVEIDRNKGNSVGRLPP